MKVCIKLIFPFYYTIYLNGREFAIELSGTYTHARLIRNLYSFLEWHHKREWNVFWTSNSFFAKITYDYLYKIL
jgi:hypothetical protein